MENQSVPPPPVSPVSNMPPKELLEERPSVEPTIPTSTEPSPVPPQPPTFNTQSNIISPPQGRGKKLIVFLLLAILMIIVIILAFLALSKRPGSSSKEIVWWETWENDGVVKPLIDEYESTHPDIKIKYIHQDKEDYRQRLQNALARGDDNAPDVFRFHNTWVPMFKNDLDNMPVSVMSPAQFVQLYFPVIQSDLSIGGGIKGLPLHFDTLALYINEDIFETYGKTAPTNWDDLQTIAKEMTIRDKADGHIKQSGVALGRVDNVDHWQDILSLMMLQNGVRMSAPSGNLAKQALLYYAQFSAKDAVWDETLPPSTQAFENGNLAMYFAPSWRAFEIKEKNPNLRFKVYPVPQLQKARPEDPDITFASYWVEGVSTKSAEKPEAWDFIKFISSKESLQKLYDNESKIRSFGEIYPRTDMANLLSSDPVASVFVRQAPYAKSWYLSSFTWDGATGINSKISKYYEDAINNVLKAGQADDALKTVSSGTSQVLSEYGISAQ